MSVSRAGGAAPPPRRPARDIIDAVIENMRKNLEPLRYSTLAPSRYTVYLHANEYARLEGIIPILTEQTLRALNDELGALNRKSALKRRVDRWRRRSEPEIRNAASDWQVDFLSDPDGDMNEGDPMSEPSCVIRVWSPTARTMPKSMTRTPSSASSTLDGLRSRWIRPARCTSARACASPAASRRTASSGSGPAASRAWLSEGPGTNCEASHGLSASGSASITAAV